MEILMPGFIHLFPIVMHDKLMSAWICDVCRKIFAFENNEELKCPHCGGRGYPLNMDVEKTESKLIVTP
jgi:rRNA maturation endonuclease Nob1